jgi:hypothetical protein
LTREESRHVTRRLEVTWLFRLPGVGFPRFTSFGMRVVSDGERPTRIAPIAFPEQRRAQRLDAGSQYVTVIAKQ